MHKTLLRNQPNKAELNTLLLREKKGLSEDKYVCTLNKFVRYLLFCTIKFYFPSPDEADITIKMATEAGRTDESILLFRGTNKYNLK